MAAKTASAAVEEREPADREHATNGVAPAPDAVTAAAPKIPLEPPPALDETAEAAPPSIMAWRWRRIVARLAEAPVRLARLDALIVIALFLAALPVRWDAARGDLWLDEAAYALASVRGFEANRWDAPNPSAADPENQLVALRHFHPPLTIHLLRLASFWGTDGRTLRAPFVMVGGLTVVLVYLCALSLLSARRRRDGVPTPTNGLLSRWAALLAAIVVLFTPAQIRAGSHALPWGLITLWLLGVAWTLLKYDETRRARWLVGMSGALGGMFVTSEYLLPTLLAVACAAPFLFWHDVRGPAASSTRRWHLGAALGAGGVVFLAIGLALWPSGLTGGTVTMLRHYIAMADDAWPVEVGGRLYERAPKWAYAFWYARDYLPYLVLYALGALAALNLLTRRHLGAGGAGLLAFTSVILLVAHKSHIIGPEYLAHALPLLTILGGLFFQRAVVAATSVHRLLALPVAAGLTLFVACGVIPHRAPVPLSGMEPRSDRERWPHAARFLAERWRPGDRILAPQYAQAGRWYLLYGAGVPASEWQVEALPERAARAKLFGELITGVYRYVVVGSTFSDYPTVDNSIRHLLRRWPVVWRSDEGGTGPSRLVIYELPPVIAAPRPAARRTPPPKPAPPAPARPARESAYDDLPDDLIELLHLPFFSDP